MQKCYFIGKKEVIGVFIRISDAEKRIFGEKTFPVRMRMQREYRSI